MLPAASDAALAGRAATGAATTASGAAAGFGRGGGAAKEANSCESSARVVGEDTGDIPPSACASRAASLLSCALYSCAAREVYCGSGGDEARWGREGRHEAREPALLPPHGLH